MSVRPLHFKRFIGTSIHHAETTGRKWWQRQLMNDPCPYCGGQSTTKEHVIPRSVSVNMIGYDGNQSNIFNNVVGACEKCNSERGNKPFLVWLGLRNGWLRRTSE